MRADAVDVCGKVVVSVRAETSEITGGIVTVLGTIYGRTESLSVVTLTHGLLNSIWTGMALIARL